MWVCVWGGDPLNLSNDDVIDAGAAINGGDDDDNGNRANPSFTHQINLCRAISFLGTCSPDTSLCLISPDCTTSVVTRSAFQCAPLLFETFDPCPPLFRLFWGLLILAGCHTRAVSGGGQARQPQDPR